jgi:hypothetical protein
MKVGAQASTHTTLPSGCFNFILVSLFLTEHAQCSVLFPAEGQYLLHLVSSLFSWLMDEACLSSLVV